MGKELSKMAKGELVALFKELDQPKRSRLPGIPPEDLMEMAADRLDDSEARIFFTTIAGFTRLAQVMTPNDDAVLARAQDWLAKRFRSESNSEIKPIIDKISQASLLSINLNITMKRLTAILNKSERAVLAEGLLDLVSLHGDLKPAQMPAIESVLTGLLLSESMAAELLANWQRKRKPKSLQINSE